MRYLNRPSAAEELVVRGRYLLTRGDEEPWATEQWERYRYSGSDAQTWRSEWEGTAAGAGFRVLAQSVVSPEGLDRVKMQMIAPEQPPVRLTVTAMEDNVLVNLDDEMSEVALPPGYGLFAPQPSLARFALPFDLASEGRELGMVYLIRLRPAPRQVTTKAVKFAFAPLGLREFDVRGTVLRGKGWRMEVPGLAAQEGWFDRHGTCLLWRSHEKERVAEARLVEWMSFG